MPNSQLTPDAFKQRIVSKYPDGKANDGTPYAQMDATELTKRIVQKYPDGTTNDGHKYSDFLQPSTPTPDTSAQPKHGLLRNIADFAFPLAGDAYDALQGKNTKTPGQILGDTALSAMWFVPGLGEAGGALRAGVKGAQIASDVAKGAEVAKTAGVLPSLAKGAATGYGVDVASNASQGKTGTDVLTPGLGAIGGGALGVAGKYAGGLLDKLASRNSTTRLTEQTQRLKTLQKSLAENSTSETNPIKTLEENGLIKGLKTPNGKIDASALTNVDHTGSMDNLIDEHSSQASDLVKSLPGSASLPDVKNMVLEAIQKNPTIADAGKVPQAEAEIERRFASYQKSFGDSLPWKKIDDIRVAMNREYDPALRDVARTIGDTMRHMLYNGSGANTAIKTAMKNEAELIKARNFVEKLHGTGVPGGQLGKYFADLMGGITGNVVGGAVGGPVGNVAGTLAGAAITNKAVNLLHGRYFNPLLSKSSSKAKEALSGTTAQKTAGVAKQGVLRGLASQNSTK